MVIIAVANGKGGVGKTSTAVNLAAGFGIDGKQVLLVDLDPGGHATTWLLGDKTEMGIAEALTSEHLDASHVVELPARPGLTLAPASPGLGGVEAALINQYGAENVLSEVLAETSKLFDVVVLDCPPSTGFLTRSALRAATHVLCPVMAGFLGLAGVVDIQVLLKQVRKRSGSRATFMGSVLFAADEREALTAQTRNAVEGPLFRAEIRLSTAGKRLPAQRATVWDPGLDARGAVDYAALLRETQRRLSKAVA